MRMRLLIAYSTTDGHTLEICERIAHIVRGEGHDVDLCELEQLFSPTLEACDRVVIGASIRYGHHRSVVAAFIARRLARVGCSCGSGRFLHTRFPDAQA